MIESTMIYFWRVKEKMNTYKNYINENYTNTLLLITKVKFIIVDLSKL